MSLAPATDLSSVPRVAVRLRFAAWVALAGAILIGTLLWLWMLRGPHILDRDGVLIGGQLLLGSMLLGVFVLLRTTPVDAIKLSPRAGRLLVLGGAVLLQAAAVVLLIPALSEDPIRYRLDGRQWLEGFSPYATAPVEVLGQERFDAIDRMVTYPQMPTIYPPVSQVVFILSAWIERQIVPPPDPVPAASGVEASPWRGSLPVLPARHHALVLRVVFATFVAASAWVLLQLVALRGISPWAVVLFAWNPLIVLECGGMGHQDIVGVFLALCALWAMDRHHAGWAAVLLALATGVKPQALLLFPFLFLAVVQRNGTRASLRIMLGGAAVLIALYLPALLIQEGFRGWWRTFQIYSQQWEANGSLYELYKHLFGHGDGGHAMLRAKQQARLLGGLAALIATALLLWRNAPLPIAGYLLQLLLLLVAPVVYPWYLAWVLCFVPLLKGATGLTGIVWSATAAISYALWRLPEWSLPPPYALAEYLPVYLALAVELLLRRGRTYAPRSA